MPSPHRVQWAGKGADAFMQRLRGLAYEALTWAHLSDWQRLEWSASLLLDVVPMKELPPWFLEKHNVTRRDIGVDLLDLDGARAVQCKCYNGTVPSAQIRHFIRVARWIFKAQQCILVTSSSSRLTNSSAELFTDATARHLVISDEQFKQPPAPVRVARGGSKRDIALQQPLRPCQKACLEACANGARVIEMACGSGKTRVMRELADSAIGQVLVLVPSHILLSQFAATFPTFCLVGTGYNHDINWRSPGFVAVYDSAHLLSNITFDHIYVDEGHHLLPEECPTARLMYYFSATHSMQPDFEYSMGSAIEDGVLCDYDVSIPIVT
ncbi:unnamed protein product, partial [Polarella glacialis]